MPVTTSTPNKRQKAKHPPIQQMVDAALFSLNNGKGCSYSAIKKFIHAVFNIEIQRISRYLSRYIKKSLEMRKIIQISGKGLTGSFRLTAAGNRPKKFAVKLAGEKRKKKARLSTRKTPKVDAGNKANYTRRRTSLTQNSYTNNRHKRRSIRMSLSKSKKDETLVCNLVSSEEESEDEDLPSTSHNTRGRAAKKV